MGTMNLLLPEGLPDDAARELERAYITGGPDNMPWPTQVRQDGRNLLLRREIDESGSLAVPWPVTGVGQLMIASGTLMERADAYPLPVELARGKVNQLRSQTAEWRAGGLAVSNELLNQIRDVSFAFGKSVTQPPGDQAMKDAQSALDAGAALSEHLVKLYVEQVFQVRQQRQPKLDSLLGCRVGGAVPTGAAAEGFNSVFNSVRLPLCWRDVEPAEADYHWDQHDALLDWAESQGLHVVAGPLIDFGPNRLPDWLGLWERDLQSIASFMCDYVETVVQRYHGRVRCWQLTTGTNCAAALSLAEDELLWLTVRLAEAARQIDSGLELIVGISQPWGDYMAREERTHSPFIFADTLIRAGLNLTAVDLEWIMGVGPNGSYCRDLLEASRLLDLYALLGVPLQLTLGYPSSSEYDPQAEASLRVDAGSWHEGFTPEVQGEWAAAFAALALCKPYVRGIDWADLSDADAHLYPHCGLFDATGAAKPAVARLKALREQHLK
jgi:hypothetical protein